MKKSHCIWAVALLLLFVGMPCQAQSLKDLLNKGNIEKAVSALTGKKTFDMTGSWVYSGSAVEFESDNLLQQAGGALAATALGEKLDEQLAKLGVESGALTFTFNTDSTFTMSMNNKTPIRGTYAYHADTDKVELKVLKIAGLNMTVNKAATGEMRLLFNSSKLLDLITLLTSKGQSSALQGLSSLAGSYDGMLLGLALKQQ